MIKFKHCVNFFLTALIIRGCYCANSFRRVKLIKIKLITEVVKLCNPVIIFML